MRAYKTVADSYVEPISFVVPRRAEVFQSDIYPPAVGSKAGVSASEWLSGESALPPKIDLESVYEGNAPKEVPSDYKPQTSAPAPTPAAAKAPAPAKKEPEPTPVAQRAPPPSVSQNKVSISEMASKFQDNDADEEDDDASSFEEIAKPVVRPQTTAAAKPQPKAASPVARQAPAQNAPATTSQLPSRAAAAPSGPPATSTPASSSVENSLDQIKRLLEQQTKTITAQSEQIGHLASEVDFLKKKVGNNGSSEQNERIKQLEQELEEARS